MFGQVQQMAAVAKIRKANMFTIFRKNADAVVGPEARGVRAGSRGHGCGAASRVAGDRPRRPAQEAGRHQRLRGASHCLIG